VGLLVLLQLPPVAIALGCISLLPVALYPLAKRVVKWPQVRAARSKTPTLPFCFIA
jgi:4-hydroxybenzoate polyprenyltransferase